MREARPFLEKDFAMDAANHKVMDIIRKLATKEENLKLVMENIQQCYMA